MSTTSVYGARTIKRERRTRAQVEQLDEQIIDVLVDDNPQSVRHVFYRMTDPRLPEPVAKTDKGKNNGYRAVQHRVVELRRSGRLPYGWITDTSRRGYFTNTYRDAGDFLRRMHGLYRADLWQASDYYCEVWVESRSLAGVVLDDCRELAVSLYPAGGFTSISLAFQAAEDINDKVLEWYSYGDHFAEDYRATKKAVILYIGDYDPAGVIIDQSLERELRKHLDEAVNLDFRRIAITPEQIAEHNLPTKPRKLGDRRSLHIAETVEAEAMPAGTMRRLLRDHIEALLPPRALEIAKAAEVSERDHLLTMATIAGGRA